MGKVRTKKIKSKMQKEREVIKLTPQQHNELCTEQYFCLEDGTKVDFTLMKTVYDGVGRHQEYYSDIVQRDSDNKFWLIC